jgi:HK97 family phage portal protein
MRQMLANALSRIAGWLSPQGISARSMPRVLAGPQWSGTNYVDAYKRNRAPTPNELMAELKNTAWACASINAAVCASNPPTLYVATQEGQAAPRCLTRDLQPRQEKMLRDDRRLPVKYRKAMRIQQVTDHPLLDLLAHCNPCHNAFDLWELTTLYQEVHGSAYWYLDLGPLGTPQAIWILPSQNVTPRRAPDSPRPVDYFAYRTGASEQRFEPERIVHFRYPDPRDPYTGGLAPLRACYEQVALMSDYAAMKKAIYENRGLPSAIISPDDVLGEEERDRLEAQWNAKFRRGGSGRVVVGESKLNVSVLQASMGDLAQLAEIRATVEDVCNAFHVPIAYMTTNTNLANLQAAQLQHLANCIHPRLERRDEKLNEQLVPLFDPTGRLFIASENPTPMDPEASWQQMRVDMQYGVRTINEMREEEGLTPVPWGNEPWLPINLAPVSVPRGRKRESGVVSRE